MAVTSTTRKSSYTGNGATIAFAFPYLFQLSSDLVVKVGGVQKTEGVDYTVAGAGNAAGGTVTFTAAPANAAAITIERTVPLTQGTSFRTQGPYTPATEEDAHDKSMMALQQLDARIAALEAAGGGSGGGATPAAVGASTNLVTNQSIPDAVETTLVFGGTPTGTFNTDAAHGFGDGTYYVPQAGKYLFSATGALNLSSLANTDNGPGYVYLRLYLNAQVYYLGLANNIRGGTFLSVSGSIALNCAQGDLIKITITQHVADVPAAYPMLSAGTLFSAAFLGT